MHPNYLNSLVKKYCGITVKESIQNRLLLEAKFLLHSTDLSIKEISNMVGFDDPNYFTSFFSRYEKLSPIAIPGFPYLKNKDVRLINEDIPAGYS